MSRLAGPLLRLVIGPASVAAFAGFELRHSGVFVAVAGAWLVFTICVFTLSAWGKIQLARTERRLHALRRRRRASRTR
jgi:predicted ester cyclase